MTPQNAHRPVDSVLIVDDSQTQRDHAVRLCRILGVPAIYEASSGQEALQLLPLLALPPRLLLLDLEMPGMDGVELMERLAQLGTEASIVVASSREMMLIDAVQTMGINLGLDVVAGLRKPLGLEVLADAMTRCCQGDKAGDSGPSSGAQPCPVGAKDLAAALDQGEIVVQYQPKADIRTGLLRGAEVLARWQHPRFGAIRPDQFIPLAEREGLIGALTLSVLDQALRQAAYWNARGLRIPIAVNLSPSLLERPGLVQEICEASNRHGVLPDQLVLELTEGSLVTQLGRALGVLARLRLKGFGLSIDDYGTGYSSMQQLARAPFTELKIDRSFVHGAHHRRSLRVILQSALDMSRQLDLCTVAEGIESLADWRLLQDLGCNVGQGWLIARPMKGDEILQWSRTHAARAAELRAPTLPAPQPVG